MRKIITNVYLFNELSQEAKEKAVETWNIEGADMEFINQDISEHFAYKLKEKGFPTDDIEYSLSYCQGDGMAFYGRISTDDMDNVVDYLKESNLFDEAQHSYYHKLKENDFGISCDIERNSFGHHYSHFNTMTATIETDDIETIIYEIYGIEYGDEGYSLAEFKVSRFLEGLENDINVAISDLSKELEKEGYSIIEEMKEFDVVAETLVINEYEFTEDGEMV